MNSAVELIIFDWDGTLFDSVGQIVQSLKYAAQEFQQPLTDEAAKRIIGLGLPEVAEILFPHVPELHDAILKSYGDHYVEHSKEDALFDGVAIMLNDLYQRGIKLAVATGKSRRGLDRVLAQTKSIELFEVTRAASETRSKPDPLMLEEILKETGITAENAIMVGDTSYDLEMAENIVMPRVGVAYGVHSVEILNRFDPLFIAQSVQELHAFLRQRIVAKELMSE